MILFNVIVKIISLYGERGTIDAVGTIDTYFICK